MHDQKTTRGLRDELGPDLSFPSTGEVREYLTATATATATSVAGDRSLLLTIASAIGLVRIEENGEKRHEIHMSNLFFHMLYSRVRPRSFSH